MSSGNYIHHGWEKSKASLHNPERSTTLNTNKF